MLESNNPIRVTHVREGPWFGGLERYILDLCRHLKSRGYSVSLILSSDAPIKTAAVEADLPYVEAAIHGDIHPLTPFRVAKVLRKLNSDIMNVHDDAAAFPICLGGRLAKIPVVATVHGFHEKWAFLAADHLITVSEALRDHLVANGIAESRVTAIRSGVDLNWFAPQDRAAARLDLGLDPDVVYFAAINRLAKRKGLELLLDTFRELTDRVPNARLLIAGIGPLEADLKAHAERLKITSFVQFLGFREDVRPLLAAADCLVLPSESEGLGLVLLEAMASGRAAIATDSGGPREVVRNGETGMLIPPRSGSELLNAMLYAVENPKWLTEAGLAARTYVEKEHSIEKEVDGVEVVYKRLMRR